MQKDNRRVFLSHSSLDKPFVRMLAADIMDAEVGIWLDELELKVNDSLIIEITKAIAESPFIAACLSPNSIQSKWVTKELSTALSLEMERQSVKVMPLILPGLNQDDIPAFFVGNVYADFRQPQGYDQAFYQLLQCINPEAVPQRTEFYDNFDPYVVPMDVHRKERLVKIAQQKEMHEWVLDYLTGTLSKRRDPTERYWVYIALGDLGGGKARLALKASRQDPDPHARMGADEAWSRIKNRNTWY